MSSHLACRIFPVTVSYPVIMQHDMLACLQNQAALFILHLGLDGSPVTTQK